MDERTGHLTRRPSSSGFGKTSRWPTSFQLGLIAVFRVNHNS
jgi:hypothetical protein